MTTETEKNRGGSFVSTWLPWMAGLGMFVFYFLTLHRGITPLNVARVADIDGVTFTPLVTTPVTFLVTYPLHWLPATLAPLALSVLTAIGAALTLVFLARSVALLPHDRTHDQRLRENSPAKTLSNSTAWIPPLFAVVVCGLQMTFWENALGGLGEMVDLVIFSFVIRCLLEYRMSRRECWLARFALFCGLGMANSYAMIGYFPLFLFALVWIMGVAAFSPRFMVETAVLISIGLVFVFLGPLRMSVGHLSNLGFWPVLKYLGYNYYIKPLTHFPRSFFALLALTSLIPMLLIGIRWASFFGDRSLLGVFIATAALHIVHGVFFLACLWSALDSAFSPRHQGTGMANSFLTIYYLGALSVGYMTGYFLLVFGTRISPTLPRAMQRIAPPMRAVNLGVTVLVWIMIILVPVVLLAKNLPRLELVRHRNQGFDTLISRMEESVPKQGAVILSDDPARLLLLQTKLHQHGGDSDLLFINTLSLGSDRLYVEFLNRTHPNFSLAESLADTNAPIPSSLGTTRLLERLSEHHSIYYLHPSFGYYFEQFYLQPHGLVYQVRPYATNEWLAPPLTGEQITENQRFWESSISNDLPAVLKTVESGTNNTNPRLLKQFEKLAKLPDETDWLAITLASDYSRDLDYWGVELEKSGRLGEAARCFEEARNLYADNRAAEANLNYNKKLRDGKPVAFDSSPKLEDQLGKYRNVTQLLRLDGPFDEPNYCFTVGLTFAGNREYRQGLQLLERVRQEVTNNPVVPLQIAQLYIWIPSHLSTLTTLLPLAEGYSNSVAYAADALRISPNMPEALSIKAVGHMQLGQYDDAVASLDKVINLQPTNYPAVLNRAIANLKTDHLDAAKADYETVLKVAPQAYQIFYGLGEIAYRQKDTPATIRNYQSYLTNYYQRFPAAAKLPDTAEIKMIHERLEELKAGAH